MSPKCVELTIILRLIGQEKKMRALSGESREENALLTLAGCLDNGYANAKFMGIKGTSHRANGQARADLLR